MSGLIPKMVAVSLQARSDSLSGLPYSLTRATVARRGYRIRIFAKESLNGAVKYGNQELVESGDDAGGKCSRILTKRPVA